MSSSMYLRPEVTFDETNDFTSDDTIDLLPTLVAGDWNVHNGRLEGTPDTGEVFAARISDLVVPPASLLLLESSFDATASGGIVFDYYGPDRFKFVTLTPSTKELVIGHRSPRRGWVQDAVTTLNGNLNGDHQLSVSLKGTTVSVELDGQAQSGHVFNAVTVDGQFGVLSLNDETSFDTFSVKTDGLDAGGVPLPAVFEAIPGDVNHDGFFDSSDLVRLFEVGEYEDSEARNSNWEDGDWNRDGEFSSSDLVLAFQVGNYIVVPKLKDETDRGALITEQLDRRPIRDLALLAEQLRRVDVLDPFGDGTYVNQLVDDDLDETAEQLVEALADGVSALWKLPKQIEP